MPSNSKEDGGWSRFEGPGNVNVSPRTLAFNNARRYLEEMQNGVPVPLTRREEGTRREAAVQEQEDPEDSDVESEPPESEPERPCDGVPMRQPSQEEEEEDEESADELVLERDDVLLKGLDYQMGACETLFRHDGRNSKALILCMALGLTSLDGNRQLADWEHDTLYLNMPSPKLFIPKVPLLRKEIQRRSRELGLATRMRTANKRQCIDWLKIHPVTVDCDIGFLRHEEGLIYSALQDFASEAAVQERERLSNANWTGDKPWLRFYCCLTHDDVRDALKNRDRAWSREELDARNNSDRPKTYWEQLSDLYNDEMYVPSTESMPELHPAFNESMELPFSEMPGGRMTAHDAKNRFADCRGKLIQVRQSTVRIILLLSGGCR